MPFSQKELLDYARRCCSEEPLDKELKRRIYEEVDGPDEDPSGEDASEDSEEGGSGDENPEKDAPEEESPRYDSLDELIDGTETEVAIEEQGSEPSPIFGSGDTRSHNKYRVTLRNGNGSASFIFWDSITNTENGVKPKRDEMVSSIAMDCAEYGNSMSLDEFRETFGYQDADAEISQKSYDGFRKTVDDLKKMFPDGEYEEFVRLGSEG